MEAMNIGYDCIIDAIMVSFWKRTRSGNEAYRIMRKIIWRKSDGCIGNIIGS